MNSSSGQASRTLIILAALVLVAAVVVYFGLELAAGRKAQQAQQQVAQEEAAKEPPKIVTQKTIGDIQFTVVSAVDLGSVLRPPKTAGFGQDITTTDKFIRVVVSAQNVGKVALPQYVWGVGAVVDSDDRNFTDANGKAFYFLPQPNPCGAELKPNFVPTNCTMIYEVSKSSMDFHIEVNATDAKSQKQVEWLDVVGI